MYPSRMEMQHDIRATSEHKLTAFAVERAQGRAARLGVDTEFGLLEHEVALFCAFPWVSADSLRYSIVGWVILGRQ